RNAAYSSLPLVDGRVPPVTWAARGSLDGVCLVSVGEEGTRLCLEATSVAGELAHAHLCYLDHASLSAAAVELSAEYDRFAAVEDPPPAGAIAAALALLLPDCHVTGVNAGHTWPSHGGNHTDWLESLGLDLPSVLRAAARA